MPRFKTFAFRIQPDLHAAFKDFVSVQSGVDMSAIVENSIRNVMARFYSGRSYIPDGNGDYYNPNLLLSPETKAIVEEVKTRYGNVQYQHIISDRNISK